MADEVGAVAHQVGDVLGVAHEVLADGGRAAPVAAPVEHEQAEALLGERPLGLPLLGAGGQGAVHEHDRLTRSPRLGVDVVDAGWAVGGVPDGHRGSSRSGRPIGDVTGES